MYINNWGEKIQINTVGSVLVVSVIVLIVVLSVVLDAKQLCAKRWQCPECNKNFKMEFRKCILVPHFGNNQLFKCPYCKKMNFCWEAKHTKE